MGKNSYNRAPAAHRQMRLEVRCPYQITNVSSVQISIMGGPPVEIC